MIRLITIVLVGLIFTGYAAATETRYFLKGHFKQGGMIQGITSPGAKVSLDGKEIRVSDEGIFVFGFGRDFKSEAVLQIDLPDGDQVIRKIEISPRKYKVEKVDGLPPSKVTPSEEFLKRIRRENAEIARIRSIDTAEDWFRSGWSWPAHGRVSGIYGSQRILNGVPKRPHFGIDVAAPNGTEVWASTDGMVRMAEKDLFYTGGTIMIDHGFGLVSVYSHLSKLSVKSGDMVKQGQKIGEIGSTGRSTGPHLDWRLNWFKERLDPELLLGPMPKN